MDGHTLGWAVALSVGMHALVGMTLDLSPGPWRHGVQPAFQAMLRPAPVENAMTGVVPPLPAKPAAREPAKREPAKRERGLPAETPLSGSSIPTAAHYYRNSEVDVRATPIEHGALVIPEHAYVSKLHGTVRARVYIDEAGTVRSVDIVEVHPFSGIFEQAALEALQQVRYAPARIAGRPVRSQKLIEVTFNPHEDRVP
jgi:TonB family protein